MELRKELDKNRHKMSKERETEKTTTEETTKTINKSPTLVSTEQQPTKDLQSDPESIDDIILNSVDEELKIKPSSEEKDHKQFNNFNL